MSRHRPQPGLRIITVLLSALAILAAACGSTDNTDSSVTTTTQPTSTPELADPVPWQPLPADGKCRSGMVLRQGESCTHEYSYEAGTVIGASGASPIIETVINDFLVYADGKGRYGAPRSERSYTTEELISGAGVGNDSTGKRHGGTLSLSSSPTSISQSHTIGDMVFKFIAYAQSDGTFYIEEATSNDSFASASQPDTTSAADCSVGMVLSVGESCGLSGGGEFSVEPDGKGCLGRSFCSGGGLTINEFSATNDDGTWTIRSVAG